MQGLSSIIAPHFYVNQDWHIILISHLDFQQVTRRGNAAENLIDVNYLARSGNNYSAK